MVDILFQVDIEQIFTDLPTYTYKNNIKQIFT